MKYFIHFLLMLLLVFVTIFSSAWVFNHVNPWLGQLTGITGGVLLLLYIYKLFKPKSKNNETD